MELNRHREWSINQNFQFTENFSDEVFTYKKSMLDRLQEIERVLSASEGKILASEVRKEWQNFMEVALEPTGWQAIWKLSRCHCENLNVRYPLEVLGSVDQVDFQELSCSFTIEAVQDDTVELPAKYDVPLIELWPLKEQENVALNIEMTADAIDQLRFFFNHIWMPWDETDEAEDWAAKNLMSRVSFYYDLISKNMHPCLASYVRHLVSELQHIAKMKELIELEMDENELEVLLGNEDVTNPKIKELMRLNFRLNSIKNELTALENPIMRRYFEKIKFSEATVGAESIKRVSLGTSSNEPSPGGEVFVIIPRSDIWCLISGLNAIEKKMGDQVQVEVRHSLQNLLDTCSHFNQIFLLSGDHFLTFSEYMYGSCNILALNSGATLKAMDDERVLLTLDGKFLFENLTFDCANVRNAVIVREGEVTFKNCHFIGRTGSSNSEGITIAESATVHFDSCTIENFFTGVLVHSKGAAIFSNTTISSCGIGIDGNAECQITCSKSTITKCRNYGIFLETGHVFEDGKAISVDQDWNKLDEVQELKVDGPNFGENEKGNVRVVGAKEWRLKTEFKKPGAMEVDDELQ